MPHEFARPWHLLRVHCESLYRSGLPYRVYFDLPTGKVVIFAKGAPDPIPPPRPPRYALPPKITLAQAQRGLADQLQLVNRLRDQVADQWRSWRGPDYSPPYNPTQRTKRARFGRWLASTCARQQNRLRMGWELHIGKGEYASCDAALGWRCPRQSQLTTGECSRGWLWAVAYRYLGQRIQIKPFRKRPANPSPASSPTTTTTTQLDRIRTYRAAKIDLEYWHEMIRLTNGGQA